MAIIGTDFGRSERIIATFILSLGTLLTGTAGAQGVALSPAEELGKKLFFDSNLSEPAGQACAACHSPEVGYTGPAFRVNITGAVYPGAVSSRHGNRKPPAAAYGGDSPLFSQKAPFEGGMFWDGRATGATLGDPLAEQAQGPFLNPLEQNNADAKTVVDKVLVSSYKDLFIQLCGADNTVTKYYECVGRSIAAYERSTEVNPYSSKYDYWIAGKANFTALEEKGRQLFEGDKAKCANCHAGPQFTDYSYDNLGVPKNPRNPFYSELDWNPAGANWVDTGLGGYLKGAGYEPTVYEQEMGKMKVPTLRNVDKRPYRGFVKAFTHNGYFKSLESIVHFYNTRDALGSCADERFAVPGINCWPASEVAENVNHNELGNLGLTAREEAAIVAFLKTLSDGYQP
jgi:cytochrome c peroxidase